MTQSQIGSSKDSNCIEFGYKQLRDATKNFCESCRLGEGGFGPVYKGKLLHTIVAIKQLRKESGNLSTDMAQQQFRTEVNILTRYRHPNLLTLMGFCAYSDNFCLIYEFMSNGTLEDALANSLEKKPELPWEVRMSIACDTARGLLYLHTAIPNKPLVHRDVKSANVLLDVSFRAKLGDFGLARPLDKELGTTKRIVGTSGYIPPEYYRGYVTVKMDSFGFGVILLEIITGKPSYDASRDPNDLISYMDPYISNKAIDSTYSIINQVDLTSGRWPTKSIYNLCDIARQCLEVKQRERATIEKIFPELEKNLCEAAVSTFKLEMQQQQKQRTEKHKMQFVNT
ncbi:interleukin-1 receptor-associated kinase 4-like [Dysidea avara]|uniref:interleukin-1 receptor-associated kinase 4-like n=1 Tax=Dysidea avara TaxID=196820 RepID=UPI003320A734